MTAIIFDLDGTLIDSAPDIHAAVARTLVDMGCEPLGLAQIRSFIGNGVPVLIDRVMAARNEAANPPRRAELISRFMRHYEAASSVLTIVYPGVEAALTELQAAGHAMGVCTNKPAAAARDILHALGLDRFFQAIIGGDSLPERKPHPAPLLAVVDLLGSKTALYVGDSEVDAQTAAAAGIPLLLFTEGYRVAPVASLPHRAAFANFAELPAIVAGQVAAVTTPPSP
ncbi:MAG: phosphoglycolate phosphatase [Paracoccaceae bacterium]